MTVVCPDLRGYGESSKPPTVDDHSTYSKRTMALDGIALMRALGFEKFSVVGHDRGGYVAQRMALDHPDAVTHLVALDMVPIGEALARCDADFAASWWHWFFLARPAPEPERLIDYDPDAWYDASYPHQFRQDAGGSEAFEDFRRVRGHGKVLGSGQV